MDAEVVKIDKMSRTMHMNMATDDDLEDLMASLSPDELNKLVDEMASDPDDKHMPASVRNSYRCHKEATGELNRDSLINHINQEGMNAPEKVLNKNEIHFFF